MVLGLELVLGLSYLQCHPISLSCRIFSGTFKSTHTSAQTLTDNSLYQLEILLSQETAPSGTAATIVEPVLGEGGYVPVPPEFLQGLRKVCHKQCWLWLEFKVEMGSYVVIEESEVKPDVLVMARVDFF